MSKGYESLSAEAYEGTGGYVRYFDITRILRWLDEHPDQVPGRTLTRSDMVEAFGEEYAGWATRRLARVGCTVVPDPEPTNAEKLRKVLDTFEVDEQNLDEVAELLDKAGVKAPGGSDD